MSVLEVVSEVLIKMLPGSRSKALSAARPYKDPALTVVFVEDDLMVIVRFPETLPCE